MSAIDAWLANASRGFCGTTKDGDPGTCSLSDMGSWGLSKAEAQSFELAAAACHQRCDECERCAWISISIRFKDCSWYS